MLEKEILTLSTADDFSNGERDFLSGPTRALLKSMAKESKQGEDEALTGNELSQNTKEIQTVTQQ